MIETIRSARPGDREALAAFATDTFEWGDYVLDRFEDWLDEPQSRVNVAVDDRDRAIAIARALLLSPTEAWLEGARVHPDHRRKGIASRLGATLIEWARAEGAQVARLAIEDWNTAAVAQVEAVGMRRVAAFQIASRAVAAAGPVTNGNGGKRAPASIRLTATPAHDADAAFMAWSSSELGRAVRGLFAVRWKWRRLTDADLRAAATGGALWSAGGGWVMAAADTGVLEVGWCDTTPRSAADLARALVDHAASQDAERVRAIVPATSWLDDAFARAGYEHSGIGVFAIGL